MAPMSPALGRITAFAFAGGLAVMMLNGLPWSNIVLLPQQPFPTGNAPPVVQAAPAFTVGVASSEYGDADHIAQVSAVLEQTPFYSQPQVISRETSQRMSSEAASDDPMTRQPTEEELRLAAMHARYTEFFRRYRKHTGEPSAPFAAEPTDARRDVVSAEDADAPQCSVRRTRARVRNVASVSGQP